MRHYVERVDGHDTRQRFNSLDAAKSAVKEAFLTRGELLRVTDPYGSALWPPKSTLPVTCAEMRKSNLNDLGEMPLGRFFRFRGIDQLPRQFKIRDCLRGETVSKNAVYGPLCGCVNTTVKGARFRLLDGTATVWEAYGDEYWAEDAQIEVVEG